MKYILFFPLIFAFSARASIVGISTHPLNEEARVLSAEMTGYMSQRHEMGMGLRYTQELEQGQLLDVTASGAQDSRGLAAGAGLDFPILKEDVKQPRVSLKPYYQHQKYETQNSNLIGAAPTLRKGLSIQGQEFFPYLALPNGIKIDSSNNEFVYYSSLTLGASMAVPGNSYENLVVSIEANKDLGASSDYIGCLVSWIWK